ncbi:venom metalloproteinase antarease TserMP_A-like isoform X2 [Dermacentor andersoni]|uniref:venom metalloproteinase antarease TserMP_A-like isoform X2 n=1 Tax=Dermacentor andersoni TaxID=34620 RepID=UPI0021551FDA|nr:venom metalloproteinase antarease TserMP_A-like isoform X2 [Dermacentor andersoni]
MHHIMTLFLLCATAKGLKEPLLVYPRLLQERSSDGRLVLQVHDDLTLNLERASVAAPQLRVLREENGASVTEVYDGHEINRDLYQDRDQLATVSVKMNGKNAEVAGIVGQNHRIQPVPTMERSEAGLIPHMVYEIRRDKVYDKALSFVENVKGSRLSARYADAKENVPREVVVEVFVVSDITHHKHFKTTKETLVYICMMMNSVNLRLTDMTSPMVRLVLTGLEKPSSEDYLHGTSDLMHDTRTIKEFQDYAFKKKSYFGRPDVVYLLSGRDVVTDGSDGKLDRMAAGIGYVAGICTSHYVALGEDIPGLFTGMHTMTHEIAHVLGSVHDGSGPSSAIERHPGAVNCPWGNGYIMSYVDNGPKHHQFSYCSLKQMQYVLTLRGRECWEVVSTPQNVSKKYPGYRNIIKKICRKAFPNIQNVEAEVVIPRTNECKLKCKHQVHVGMYIKTYSITKNAPDYTPCGDKKACVRGYCVYAPNVPPRNTGGRKVLPGSATPPPRPASANQ